VNNENLHGERDHGDGTHVLRARRRVLVDRGRIDRVRLDTSRDGGQCRADALRECDRLALRLARPASRNDNC
jgi:hypothetical protein